MFWGAQRVLRKKKQHLQVQEKWRVTSSPSYWSHLWKTFWENARTILEFCAVETSGCVARRNMPAALGRDEIGISYIVGCATIVCKGMGTERMTMQTLGQVAKGALSRQAGVCNH